MIGDRRRADPWSLTDRRLYLCTPDRHDLPSFVANCIAGGVDVVQLREKALPDPELLDRAAVVQRVCSDHGVPFILNDRPDLAAELGADGVHVGQEDPDVWHTRAVVGPDAIVGLSTHLTAELDAALGVTPVRSGGGPTAVAEGVTDGVAGGVAGAVAGAAPVDYVSAGPVVATPTKPGRPGTGLGYVFEAVARAPWPVWVTGGVDPSSVGRLIAGGARHFVVVRWLTRAEDPGRAARTLRRAIDVAIDRSDRSSV